MNKLIKRINIIYFDKLHSKIVKFYQQICYVVDNKERLVFFVQILSAIITIVVGSTLMYYAYGYTLAFGSATNLEEYINQQPLNFILGRLILGAMIIFLSLLVYCFLIVALSWIIRVKTILLNQKSINFNIWFIIILLFVELFIFILYSFYDS